MPLARESSQASSCGRAADSSPLGYAARCNGRTSAAMRSALSFSACFRSNELCGLSQHWAVVSKWQSRRQSIGYIPPAEAEERYYLNLTEQTAPACTYTTEPLQNPRRFSCSFRGIGRVVCIACQLHILCQRCSGKTRGHRRRRAGGMDCQCLAGLGHRIPDRNSQNPETEVTSCFSFGFFERCLRPKAGFKIDGQKCRCSNQATPPEMKYSPFRCGNWQVALLRYTAKNSQKSRQLRQPLDIEAQ